MSHESAPNLKDRAFAAYTKFIEQGETDPAGLDLDNPEVQEAHKLFQAWMREVEDAAKGDREKELLANFAITTFYVDAGFRDPEYLKDVLGYLDQDLENAEEGEDEPLLEVAEKIKAKMVEIEGMIAR